MSECWAVEKKEKNKKTTLIVKKAVSEKCEVENSNIPIQEEKINLNLLSQKV